MARYENRLLDVEADGIQEYDNRAPGWLMAIFYGSIVFSILYIIFYALSFGPGPDAEWAAEMVKERAGVQKYFVDHPVVAPSSERLLGGAVDPDVLAVAKARFLKTCSPCHGEQAQGLIGPNLTDDSWIHGGKVTEIFTTIVNGVPAKGMPPWGRGLKADEIAALASYIRSLQGSSPAGAKAPEGDKVAPEPLPGKKG